MKKYLLLLFVLFSNLVFAQTQEKIYYNSNWKVCTRENASFYRIATIDTNRQSIGIVRDYYITGELQWEGQFSYIDRHDNSKDIATGNCVWYHKNGQKSQESYLINGLNEGKTTFWDKNGRKQTEYFFQKGQIVKPIIVYGYYENGNIKYKVSVDKEKKKDGECTWFYENGKKQQVGFYKNDKANGLIIFFNKDGIISSMNEFNNDKPTNKFWIRYDDYNKEFYKYFRDSFSDTNNPNGWFIGKDNYREAKYYSGSIIYKLLGKDGGNRNSINLNLENNRDYTISIKLERISGDKGKPFGLIWGLKNWENYNYFYTSSYGGYKVGCEFDGFDIDTGWKETNATNTSGSNELRVKKVGNKMYFAINGNLVHTREAFSLYGTEIGFMIYGNTKIHMQNIEVRQDFKKEDFKNLLVKYYKDTDEDKPNNREQNINDWKGNGTGFFIDKRGYIATNYHVIEGSSVIEVEFLRNGIRHKFPAQIVKSDPQNDLSIIKIVSSQFRPFYSLPYNFNTHLSAVGTNVFALGYPMALSLMGKEIKFTDGKISSKTGMRGNITTYQISVPIQPGNSGGPLFDYNGNLVGITSSTINRKYDMTENVNYAIKSAYLKNLVDVLDYKLNLPNNNQLVDKTLPEKIKILSDYVVLIKVK